MISTIELYKAIRERLEETFPNVLIQQKDIKNITRPSFYIQYVGKNLEKIAVELYEDRISFNIIYFSEKEELLELLEIEEAFVRAFNKPLIIPDDKCVPQDENSLFPSLRHSGDKYIIEVEKDALQSNLNEEDYFLNLTIDFVLSQRMSEDESGEDIEDIDLTYEVGAKAEAGSFRDSTTQVENENKSVLTEYTEQADDSPCEKDENDEMSEIEL